MICDGLFFWLIVMIGGFSFFVGAMLGWALGE